MGVMHDQRSRFLTVRAFVLGEAKTFRYAVRENPAMRLFEIYRGYYLGSRSTRKATLCAAGIEFQKKSLRNPFFPVLNMHSAFLAGRDGQFHVLFLGSAKLRRGRVIAVVVYRVHADVSAVPTVVWFLIVERFSAINTLFVADG